MAINETIAHYRIVGPLGEGGMGVVYQARDERLGRMVALKLLKPRSDAHAIERFFREASAASSLNHPNIVTVYDVGETEAGYFIAMELVRGRVLRSLMAQPIELDTLLSLGRQMAEALAVAHEAGIVHRDIKPENIMVRDDGYIKILDFGLARVGPPLRSESGALTTTDATQGSVLVGTIKYISPEQASGDVVGSPSDVFSLGLVLYELATRRHPFDSESVYGVVHSILSHNPLPPWRLNAELSGPLDALILRMLEKDPTRRPSASEVAAALARPPAASALAVGAAAAASSRHSVGRRYERAELRGAFDSVSRGRGLLLCISGEAGIGKSTLVEDFLTEIAHAGVKCHVARGRCSERLAGTEAYLPLLDAMEDLLRSDRGSLARLMKAAAPLWHAQLESPDPHDSTARSAVTPTQRGTQERLKREVVAFFEEACREGPIILFFDDVHWVDMSTVDVLSYLARRFQSLPLMIVATYRPEELLGRKHPFVSTMRDLQGRGLCREVALEFLTRDEIEQYVTLKFPNHRLPPIFLDVIYSKTEGNPLFVVDVLDYLYERHVLACEQGVWTLTRSVPDIAQDLPESVRGMIRRKVDTFTEADRRLLVAASVQGYEFDAAVVAKVLGADAADVEDRLDAIDTIHGFVRRVREEELPDRTMTLRYRFVHVLYQNMLYDSLTPARKASISLAVGNALEEFYRGKTNDVVSELAVLFEAAREFSRASDHFLAAARKAVQVFAYEEAFVLGHRALDNLLTLADDADRRRRELVMLSTIGVPAIAARGFSSPDVQRIFDRASTLSAEFHETEQLALALWGLAANNIVKLQLEDAWEAAERLKQLTRHGGDVAVAVQPAVTAGIIHYYRGEFESAIDALAGLETRCSLDLRREMCRTRGYDQIVAARCYRAWSLWCVGYPDRALAELEAALESAADVDHLYTLAFALTFASVLDFWRGDWDALRIHNERTMSLASQEGFGYFAATSISVDGLDLVHQGQREAGLARMREALKRFGSMDARASLRRVATEYAEQLAVDRRVDEGLSLVNSEIEATASDRFWDAELFRVKGELLSVLADRSATSDAEHWMQRAVDAARGQHARSFELRAAISLCRLWQREGKLEQARALLAETHGWFTEGFGTADLEAARKLLADMKDGTV